MDSKLGEPRPSSITMHVQWVPWDIGKQSGMAALPLLLLHTVGFLSITGSISCSCIPLTGHRQQSLWYHAWRAARMPSMSAQQCAVDLQMKLERPHLSKSFDQISFIRQQQRSSWPMDDCLNRH